MEKKTMRWVRALASILLGFFLVTGWFFTPLGVLTVLAHLVPLPIFGALLMLGGILVLAAETRMYGYFMLGVLWAATVLTALIQLRHEQQHSVTIFLYALTAAVYFEGFADSIKNKYN